jgi:hypothetical protein
VAAPAPNPAVVHIDTLRETTGRRLLLVHGPRAVQRPFERCGLANRLPFVDAVVAQAT